MRLCVFVLITAFFLDFSLAASQSTLTIEGTVRDATGAPVTGASVEARGTALVRSAPSDASGRYRIDGLSAGRYTLRAELSGFAPATITIDLADSTTSSDLTLGSVIAAASTTVTGAANPQELDVPAASASRLGLTPRETPATVDVITFADAQERGLRTATEALTTVPGVSSAFLPSAQGITAIRGFTGGAISTLFDGTRVTTSTIVTRNYDTWSFDRIEVLKGPASVLYGEGALAGAVNFVPKRPDFSKPRREVLLSYGSLNTGRLAAAATGPLADGRAAYRADVSWNRTDNYIDDSESNTLSINGALDIKLGSRATLGLAVDHFRDDYGSAYFGTPLVARASARRPSDIVTDSRGWVIDAALRDANYDVDRGVTEINTTWGRTRLDLRLSPSWRLTNDLYFYDKGGTWRNAEVYTFVPASGLLSRSTVSIGHDHQFYGDRAALISDANIGSRRNRFVVGFESNRNEFFSPRRFGSTTAVDPFNPIRGTFPADTAESFPGAGNRQDFATTIDLVSLFAEEAFAIAPRVTIVGGLRYDRLAMDRRVDDLNAGAVSTFERTFHPVSGRGGVVVDLLPRTQLFGQYTSAVAPVATPVLLSQANAAFDLTTGSSWEGGVKSTLAGGRLEATASIFTITQDNILTRDPDNFNITIQGGTQASTGLELSIGADVTRRLRIDANAAFMDARFETLIEAGGISRAGNLPPNVPERTARLWVSYAIANTPVAVAAGVRHQSRFFTNNANTTEVSGFTLVDAQLSWRVRSGEIAVRGRNLTDRLYGDWTGASANQVQLGAPRTVDLSYHVRF